MTKKLLCAISAVLVAVGASAQTAVLRVNGVEVAKNEFDAAKRALASQLGGQKVDPHILDRGAMEQIVGRILLAQAARDAKVTLEPGTVAKTIEEQKKQAGGQEQFVKGLSEVGLTEKDVERVLGETLLVHRYVQSQLAPQVNVTEAEAKKYYDEHPDDFKRSEEVKLRMILAEAKPGADEAARTAAKAKADKALERITKGEPFAKVAAELSDDPTKTQGGEVGWVARGRLLRDIEPTIFALKNGETTAVLATKYGYNLFRVDDRRAPRTATFDEVKSDFMKALQNRQLEVRVREQVAALKAKAKIEILDSTLKASIEAATTKPGGTDTGPGAPSAQAPAKPEPKK